MEINDHIIIWEAPKIEKPEFRVYYDDNGKLLCYSCEKLEGKYIVVDAQTFAESRPDIRVIDGKLVRNSNIQVISKLIPSDNNQDIYCHTDDVCVVVDVGCKEKKGWKLHTYEL